MTAVTIAGQVAAVAEAPARQPPGEAMAAFARSEFGQIRAALDRAGQ